MGMSIDEAITRYKNNAEYERTHGNLQGCLEFRQLAKWLEQLQKIKQIFKDIEECSLVEDYALDEIREVLEKENENVD